MDFWEKIKSDIQKGIKEGIGIVKEGVTVVKEKAEEISGEGKRRLKIFELKTKVQREISDLGGRVYALSAKVKNPMLDKKVTAVLSRIKKLESQIMKLEGKQHSASRRPKRAAVKAKK
jgi:peptidoglycan hydrolase CwlO-like protein